MPNMVLKAVVQNLYGSTENVLVSVTLPSFLGTSIFYFLVLGIQRVLYNFIELQ